MAKRLIHRPSLLLIALLFLSACSGSERPSQISQETPTSTPVPVEAAAIASDAPEGPFPPAAPESVGLSEAALAELAGIVEGYVADGRIVGAEILVIKNRRTVLHEAYGWKDRDDGIPLEIGTIYNIRSMTKPLTGAAAQCLIDEGLIALDDRVADLSLIHI